MCWTTEMRESVHDGNSLSEMKLESLQWARTGTCPVLVGPDCCLAFSLPNAVSAVAAPAATSSSLGSVSIGILITACFVLLLLLLLLLRLQLTEPNRNEHNRVPK